MEDVRIRPADVKDVKQLVRLGDDVRSYMVLDIMRHHLTFLVRQPWPYAVLAVSVAVVKLLTQCTLLEACLISVVLATLEEFLRFGLFCSMWLSIFYGSDATQDLMDKFSMPNRNLLVAEVGGRVVGCVGVMEQDPERPLVGQIANVYVADGFRNYGIGRRLIEAAAEELRRFGYTSVELLTHHSNKKGLKFYIRLGYSQFNTIHYTSLYPYFYDQYEFRLQL